jgi:hypothetical protein
MSAFVDAPTAGAQAGMIGVTSGWANCGNNVTDVSILLSIRPAAGDPLYPKTYILSAPPTINGTANLPYSFTGLITGDKVEEVVINVQSGNTLLATDFKKKLSVTIP